MNNEIKLLRLKERYNRLNLNGKNIKSPGVLRKLRRQIRNMEQ